VPSGELFCVLEEEAKKVAWRAHRHFSEFCRRWRVPVAETAPAPHTVSAAWHDAKGGTVEITLKQARLHDLAVFARGPEPRVLEAAVMGSGRPVLIAPKKAPENLAPTVAVAWKDTADAARALMAAMPLLMKADRILVLTAEEGNGQRATINSAERVVRYLAWHGLSGGVHYVPHSEPSGAQALVQTALDNRADLLVMGGYGHSRLREFVLGGVTREVLRDCPLPVLMFH
jgi:nucleotide-binding universal stress UspA family protein